MFNNQYNRSIANEVARIDRKYVMDNVLHGEGKMQHKLGNLSQKEEMELLQEVVPLANISTMKSMRGRPKRHMKLGSGDLSEMEGSGFFSDMWDGVKQGLSTAVEIAPDAINLARSMGYGKPKKTRGRPKKVGSAMSAGAMSAGAMSAGAMSAGAMSAGAMSAGAMSAGAKKYKKKVQIMDGSAMSAGAMSAGAMSGGAMSGGAMSFDEIVKGLNKHKKDMEGGIKRAKKGVKKAVKKVVKEVKPVDGKITRKQRGEAVKAMMKKHSVSLGEASKMVSKHLKGGGFFDSLLKLAPLATLLI